LQFQTEVCFCFRSGQLFRRLWLNDTAYSKSV